MIPSKMQYQSLITVFRENIVSPKSINIPYLSITTEADTIANTPNVPMAYRSTNSLKSRQTAMVPAREHKVINIENIVLKWKNLIDWSTRLQRNPRYSGTFWLVNMGRDGRNLSRILDIFSSINF